MKSHRRFSFNSYTRKEAPICAKAIDLDRCLSSEIYNKLLGRGRSRIVVDIVLHLLLDRCPFLVSGPLARRLLPRLQVARVLHGRRRLEVLFRLAVVPVHVRLVRGVPVLVGLDRRSDAELEHHGRKAVENVATHRANLQRTGVRHPCLTDHINGEEVCEPGAQNTETHGGDHPVDEEVTAAAQPEEQDGAGVRAPSEQIDVGCDLVPSRIQTRRVDQVHPPEKRHEGRQGDGHEAIEVDHALEASFVRGPLRRVRAALL